MAQANLVHPLAQEAIDLVIRYEFLLAKEKTVTREYETTLKFGSQHPNMLKDPDWAAFAERAHEDFVNTQDALDEIRKRAVTGV